MIMDIKFVIKSIMVDNNLSQEKMANQTTVSQWLLGKKKPSFDNIYAIYKNFGITPNELFGIDDLEAVWLLFYNNFSGFFI